MATWTKSDLSAKVLELLLIKAAGQDADADDDALVKSVIDSVYEQLQPAGLAPFGIEEIPTWAQLPLVKYVVVEAGPFFGKVSSEELKNIATRELAAQVYGGPKQARTTRAKSY